MQHLDLESKSSTSIVTAHGYVLLALQWRYVFSSAFQSSLERHEIIKIVSGSLYFIGLIINNLEIVAIH